MVKIITVQSHGSSRQHPAKEQSRGCSDSVLKDAWHFANKALPPWKALTSLNARPRSWTNFLPAAQLSQLDHVDLKSLIPPYHFSFTVFVLPPPRSDGPSSFVVLSKSSTSPEVFTHASLWDINSSVTSTQVTHKHCSFISLCFSKGTGT